MKARTVVEEIFETPIRDEDLNRNVSDVLEWSSYEILTYMVEMSERWGADVTIEQISMVETVWDLLQLTEECRLWATRGK